MWRRKFEEGRGERNQELVARLLIGGRNAVLAVRDGVAPRLGG